VLVCSDNDENNDDDNPLATQISCQGDELVIGFYDSCESKNCQFLGIPVSNSTFEATNSLNNNALCIFTGTIDSCQNDDLVFKVRPCGSGGGTLGGTMDHQVAQHLKTMSKLIHGQVEQLVLSKRAFV
jgi:hypothetical protein